MGNQPVVDYEIKYFSKGKGKNFISFRYIGEKLGQLALDFAKLALKPETYIKAKALAPNYDIRTLEEEWHFFINRKREEVIHPDAAFLGFCKVVHKKNPYP